MSGSRSSGNSGGGNSGGRGGNSGNRSGNSNAFSAGICCGCLFGSAASGSSNNNRNYNAGPTQQTMHEEKLQRDYAALPGNKTQTNTIASGSQKPMYPSAPPAYNSNITSSQPVQYYYEPSAPYLQQNHSAGYPLDQQIEGQPHDYQPSAPAIR